MHKPEKTCSVFSRLDRTIFIESWQKEKERTEIKIANQKELTSCSSLSRLGRV
jgi:hypothetical protein